MEQISSAAAQVIIALIPLVGIVMGAAVVFFYLLWNHRRKVLLIGKGQDHRSAFDLHAYSLLAGLLLTSVGVALTVFLAIVAGPTYGLLGGIIPLAIGAGLLVFYGINRSHKVQS